MPTIKIDQLKPQTLVRIDHALEAEQTTYDKHNDARYWHIAGQRSKIRNELDRAPTNNEQRTTKDE
jgi:hypothetical protein